MAMKTVTTINLIGLRETAGIIYMRYSENGKVITVEEFLERIDDAFDQDRKKLIIGWDDVNACETFVLWR